MHLQLPQMNPPITISISVILPVYNSERWLSECINSILEQTLRPLEIIAVNDGSTDDSQTILARYGDILTILNQPNRGASAARNAAAQVARGEWLAFIDSDDTWNPSKLQKQAELLTSQPDVVGAYCGKNWVNQEGNATDKNDACMTYWPSGQIFLPLLLSRSTNGFSPSQAIIKRHIFLQCGGFPENLRHAEDYALWLKLAQLGPILYQIDPLVNYRRHPNSVSVEPQAEFGRLEARYHILQALRPSIRTSNDRQIRNLFDYELYETSIAFAYHSRIRGGKHAAREAYLNALQLRPISWKPYVGLLRSIVS